jgi:predicted phosphoribosyltransferase
VRPFPDIKRQKVIVVDDGLASGFTMQVAIEALQKADAQHIIVAVPTGHENAVRRLSAQAETLCCPNIRGGWYFAVADAYRQWADVDETEALKLVTQLING